MAKLKILGYKSDPLGSGGGGGADEFVAGMNPEKFSFSRTLQLNEQNNSNTSKNVRQYQGSKGATLSFDLLMDGTGIAYDAKSGGVGDELKNLQEVVYNYDGNEHKPNYLKVVWGDFSFYCHLDRMSVDCSMFNTDGKVLRAKVSLSFTEHSNPEYTEADSWNRSPDLTHIKTVRIGDNLTQMSKDIYGDSKYYMQVAQVNELVNFRTLKIGQQLVFPPLEK